MTLLRSLIVKKDKIVRKKRNSFVPTTVKGIRAENYFWEKCAAVAKKENTSRNELIVRVVSEYLEGVK